MSPPDCSRGRALWRALCKPPRFDLDALVLVGDALGLRDCRDVSLVCFRIVTGRAEHLRVREVIGPAERTGDDVVEDAGLLPKRCAAALAMALAALQRLAS